MIFSPARKVKYRTRREQPQVSSLSLTSMMDMFTIMLFFLLKSFSTEGDIVTLADNLQLPISTSQIKPVLTLNLMVSKDSIIVEGKEVELITNITNDNSLLIKRLADELRLHAEKSIKIANINESVKFKGNITIQADKTIPFNLLKKIIYTCGQMEFSNISLAVFENE